MFFFLTSACSLLSQLVVALPVSPAGRTVYTPPVTYPNSNTVWIAGCSYPVTWNTSGLPLDLTNQGEILLRRYDQAPTATLAEGFLLISGEVNVTVPLDTQPATDWVVNLFGDSGDRSQNFTILAPSSCPL